MISRTKKGFKVLLLVASVLLFSVAIWLLTSDAKLMSVQTGSMRPNINPGDLVAVIPVANQDVSVGDVITFTSPKGPVTHRVINTDGQTLITQGDANNIADQPINSSQIIGKTALTVPMAGYLLEFIRQPLGLLLMVYLPAAAVIHNEIVRLARHYDKQRYVLGKKVKLDHCQSSVTVNVFVSLLVVPLLGAVTSKGLYTNAALASKVTYTDSDISVQSFDTSTAIEVCQFPADDYLLSYSFNDARVPNAELPPINLDTPIPAGNYQVSASSYDNHSTHAFILNQPNESWYAELYAANSLGQIAQTGPTADLADDQDSNITVVNPNLRIESEVTALRYLHASNLTGLEIEGFNGTPYSQLSHEQQRSIQWNSVYPVCLYFEPIEQSIVPG